MTVWEKYNKLEECDNQNNDNFKTYLVQKKYYMKEIPFKTEEDKITVIGKIEIMKNEIKIYDIIEEQSSIYVVIDYEKEQINKFNCIYNNDSFKCESIIKGQPNYSNLSEIQKLYKKGENKLVKIDIKYNNKRMTGTGFFLEIKSNLNLPFTKALVTCNHVLNENFLINNEDIDLKYKNKNEYLNIKDSQIFTIENYKVEKKAKRKIFTDPSLDFTCIELLENDFQGKYELYKIKEKNNEIKNKEIFILHYPPDNDLSFSLGKILKEQNYYIGHNASTEGGSSGSPIITRDDLNVIGMHKGGDKIINFGYFMEDIMRHIKDIFSNIISIKQIIDKLSSEKIIVNFNCSKYLKKTILKEGNIGAIFESFNKNNEKILIIEINWIKLFISISGKDLLYEIKKIIEIIKRYNVPAFQLGSKLHSKSHLDDNNILDIYLEGNSLNIVLFKYEIRFIEYFNNKNKELKDYEVYSLIEQFKKALKYPDFISKFNPDNIIIENINAVQCRFIEFYYSIIDINIKSNNLFSPSQLDGLERKSWRIGIFLYFLTKKGEYPFNLTNSEDIIKNIKNGKEIPVNKNSAFSEYIINSLKDYKLPEYDYNFQNKLENKVNQELMPEIDKNFCIKNQGSICYINNNKEYQTGFFCKVNCNSIPFKRALITFGFLLSNEKSIIIYYLKDNKLVDKIINLDNRKKIITKHDEIIFIELFENDDIENFFELEENNLKEKYESNDIILLQYGIDNSSPYFCFSSGKIINYEKFLYETPTLMGAMSSPIILGNNNHYLIGIHMGRKMKGRRYEKYGVNLYYLLKDI